MFRCCGTVEVSKGVRFNQREKQMPCKICIQLEEAVAALTEPDRPSILLGLNVPGLRNRARQKDEQQIKVKMDLEKHRRSFHKTADGPAS
jgi:hypothetical protein